MTSPTFDPRGSFFSFTQGRVEPVHARLVSNTIRFAIVLDSWFVCSDLTYPRCTSSPTDETESDCGSTPWAFGLFIAWNLLSMVRFCLDVIQFEQLREFEFSTSSSTCLLVLSWRTFPTCSKPLGVGRSLFLESRCERSRRSGPNTRTRRLAIWRDTALPLSSR